MATKDADTQEADESFNHYQPRECSFDVDMTVGAEQKGEVTVRMELDGAESESVWEQIQGDGHTYPEDARERVLSALQYNVQCAGRDD